MAPSSSVSLPLTVVVPVHRPGPAFDRCVRALESSLAPNDEFVLVADGTSLAATSIPSGARVVSLSKASGPAIARNAGAACATADVLVFIDSDVEVHAQTISRIRSAFEGDPALDALIGSYDDAPEGSSILSRYRNLLHHYTHQHSEVHARTFWGACGAVRTRVFESAGGFDPAFREPSIEDIEFGYRISAAGARIELRKDIQVKHLKDWKAHEVIRTDVLQRAAPWTRLLLSRRSAPTDLNLQWSHRLSVVASGGLLILLPSLLWNVVFSSTAMGAIVLSIYLLNRPFYRFLRPRLGAKGTLVAAAWHWVHYLCAGAGAMVGVAQHVLVRGKRSASLNDQIVLASPGRS